MAQSIRIQDIIKAAVSETSAPHDQATPGPVTQSDRFWLDDGNIILQAENTQFRVHRSILSMNSNVMKDCFSLPQPQSEVNPDGCPVVHITDSAQDIENMCAMFYSPAYSQDENSISSSYLKTMFRLGWKYDILVFQNVVSNYLQRTFPTTLAGWDEDDALDAAVNEDKGFLFNVINYAYQYNLRPILPAAVLSLFRYHSLEEILSGVNVSDGKTESVISLQPQALTDCIMCRTGVLVSFFAHMSNSFRRQNHSKYSILTSKCQDIRTCSVGILDCLHETVTGKLLLTDTYNEYLYYHPHADAHYRLSHQKLCGNCAQLLESAYTGARLKLWTSLPKYFQDRSSNPVKRSSKKD